MFEYVFKNYVEYVSIPKRVLEALNQSSAIARPTSNQEEVSIPKRVLEALNPRIKIYCNAPS